MHSIHLFARRMTPLLGLVLAAACVAGPGSTVAPAPSRIQELERVWRGDTSDVDVAELLGAAYLGANRGSDARTLFASVHAARSNDRASTILLGLTDEDLGDVIAARKMYATYLTAEPRGPYVPVARGRLDKLIRKTRAEEARIAVARGSTANVPAPDPRLVVVMPLAPLSGSNRVLALAAAMSDMLHSDLAASKEFHVVTRGRVVALLDALAVPPEGWSSSEVAQRVGRLLGAGTVVQGSFSMQEHAYLQVRVNVVRLSHESGQKAAAMNDRAPLRQIGLLERRVTRFVYEHLGIQWSAPMIRRMASSWTAEPDAWVALGHGIMAMDAGDYGTARRFFEQASHESGPPNAKDRARRAAYMLAAAEPIPTVAWRVARETVQRRLVARLEKTPETGYGKLEGGLADRGRGVAAELLGESGVGVGTTIGLVFVTGGGSQ